MIIKSNYPIIIREMSVDGISVSVPTDSIGRIADIDEIRELYNDLQIVLDLSDQQSIDNYNERVEEKVYENMKTHSNNSKEKEYTEGLVYLLKSEEDNIYKIGVTTNINQRLPQIATKLPFKIKLEHKIKHNAIYQLEGFLHEKFNDKRLNGEWFRLDKNDVEYIKSEAKNEEVV